jgi:hypothetical protein
VPSSHCFLGPEDNSQKIWKSIATSSASF